MVARRKILQNPTKIIVREDYLINATIDCFSIDDNTEFNKGFTKYKWLK